MNVGSSGRVRLLIFFACFVIFCVSPVTVVEDSRFALLTAESLLKSGTPSLNQFDIPGLDQLTLPSKRDLLPPVGFYQLERVKGRILYAYPHGSSFLSVPFVAALDALGLSTVKNGKTYDAQNEAILAKLLASLLMAAAASLFFEIGINVRLPVLWSVILTVGGTLGSQIWSSASRTLWSQSWEVLLASCTILLLLRADRRGVSVLWLGSLLAWMFFVRPTAAVSILGVTLYVWLFYRQAFAGYMTVLLVWMVGFVFYWLMIFGGLPDYYRRGSFLKLTGVAAALPAILVSPSRGLVVFVPTIPLVAYLLARYWKSIDHQIAILAVGIICGNLLVVASYPVWWGGWSYGPRLLTSTIPWFVLLGALGCQCLAAEKHRSTCLLWLGLSVLLLAVAINGWGAICWKTTFWNSDVAIDEHPGSAWDWRHPQFLAGL
jgi:hypothetical protein